MVSAVKDIYFNHFRPKQDILQDPVWEKLAWSPAKMGGSNFRTCDLKIGGGTIRVRKSGAFISFLLVLVLMAMLALMIGMSAYNNGLTLGPLELIGSGILFAVPPLLMLGSKELTFDRRRGIYYRGRRPKGRGRENYGRLTDIHALQILPERISVSDADNKSHNFFSYELNLVLKDGGRLNVMDHGDLKEIERAASALGMLLGTPVWQR